MCSGVIKFVFSKLDKSDFLLNFLVVLTFLFNFYIWKNNDTKMCTNEHLKIVFMFIKSDAGKLIF